MSEQKEEKLVAIFNGTAGPMHTVAGVCAPNESIEVPESVAEKLCKYKGVRRADAVVPSLAKNDSLAKENSVLKAANAQLEADNAELLGRLQEFMAADSKKALDALKEKHADLIPADPADETPAPEETQA